MANVIIGGGNVEMHIDQLNTYRTPGWILVRATDTTDDDALVFILNERELEELVHALHEAMADSYESKGATA